jgi:hypothetical protein
MSGFKVFSTGQDLDAIFATRTGTDPSAQLVPFVTPAGQNLSERFLKYTSGTKASATGYKCFDINGNMVDLSELYSKIPPWSTLTTPTVNGVDNVVNTIAVLDANNIFVGGFFRSAGDVSANFIARWNGSTWSALGTPTVNGVDNEVESIAVLDANNIFVGGRFTTAGGVSANRIAKWNAVTSSWSALGTPTVNGVNNPVLTIAVLDANNIFVGGFFTSAGSISANRIAKWNAVTSSWSALGTPTVNGVDNAVLKIAVLDATNVFVGGLFTAAGGTSNINRIAKWNGNTWSALGTPTINGVSGTVYAIDVLNASNIFVGGDFTSAGGGSANCIAKWNGSTWSALGTPTNGVSTAVGLYVESIAVLDANNIFVGGGFTSAGGGSANRIAKWNGSTWSALGSGMNNSVYTIDVLNASNIFVGGRFTTAGGVPANYIARWNG